MGNATHGLSVRLSRVDGLRTDVISGVPPGTMRFSESFVESSPIFAAGHRDAIVVRGKFDVIVTLDDGSYATRRRSARRAKRGSQ